MLLFYLEIVMTPTSQGNTTRITIEKVKKDKIDESKIAHKAGGQHAGLVINNPDEGKYYFKLVFLLTDNFV